MTSALAVISQPAAARVRLEPRVSSRRVVRIRGHPRGHRSSGGARHPPRFNASRYFLPNPLTTISRVSPPWKSIPHPSSPSRRLPIADARLSITRRGVVTCSLTGDDAPRMMTPPDDDNFGKMAMSPSRPKSVLADFAMDTVPASQHKTANHRIAKATAAVALGSASLLAAHAALPPAVPGVGIGVARAGTFSHIKDYTMTDVLYYRFQKIFALPLLGKIFCLVAFTVPVVFAGAIAYKLVDLVNAKLDGDGGENETESWTDALANSFYLLNNVPGADATTDEWDTPSGQRRGFVTQFIVFVGLFVFAIIIGIISDEITAQVEEVKTGNNKVVESDHTVIVNWNSQLVPLLKQMAVAKSERAGTFDRPVVLLADVDKELMDETIGEALEESPPLQVSLFTFT